MVAAMSGLYEVGPRDYADELAVLDHRDAPNPMVVDQLLQFRVRGRGRRCDVVATQEAGYAARSKPGSVCSVDIAARDLLYDASGSVHHRHAVMTVLQQSGLYL